MGSNNLTSATDGTTITTSIVDQYKTALNGDLVPRNSAGIATDVDGSIGSSVYRWLKGWFGSIGIGTVASNNTIEEDSGDMIIKINGTEKFRLGGTTGISAGLAGDALTENATGGLDVSTGGITAVHIATDAVGADEIVASAVGTTELASSAVTTVKIANQQVTTIKQSARAVSSSTATTNDDEYMYKTSTIPASGSVTSTLSLKGAEGLICYGFTQLTSSTTSASITMTDSTTFSSDNNCSLSVTNSGTNQSRSTVVATGSSAGTTITFTVSNSGLSSRAVRFWAYELF